MRTTKTRTEAPAPGLAGAQAYRVLAAVLGALLLVSAVAPLSAAYDRNVKFTRISLDDGLSQAFANAILQDSRGFMWFGTQEGLNLYDGTEFRVFAHEAANPNSLSHDLVKVLLEDRRGHIWIGTDGGGLNRFDPTTETFVRVSPDFGEPETPGSSRVWALLEDNKGRLWVGTDGAGLYAFDPQSGTSSAFRHDARDVRSLANDQIRGLAEDGSGGIWVATEGGGVDYFDPESGVFRHMRHDPEDPASLASDRVRALLVDSKGHLWIGTYDGGLDRYEPDRGRITHFQHDPEDPASLAADGVRSLFESRDGTIWVGTHEGLSVYDADSDSFYTLRNDQTDPYSLSHDRVVSIYEDRGGLLWVGTFNGLNTWNTSTGHFLHYRGSALPGAGLSEEYVSALAESSGGRIWIGTYGGGLNRFDPQTRRFSYIRTGDGLGLGDDRVMSLLVDRRGTLWAGTFGDGLHRYNEGSGRFERFAHDPSDPASLSADGVTVMAEGEDGSIWVGTYKGGVNRFDPESGRFERFQHDSTDPHSLTSDRVLGLLEDSSGTLWVGTYGAGLNRLDRESGRFAAIRHDPQDPQSLSKDDILSLFEDSRGNLWIGTQGGGLNHWSRDDRERGLERFTRLTTRTGLRSNTINAILEDDRGDIWISTNNGLSRISPAGDLAVNYDTSHGLLGEFNYGAALKTSSGQILFGGIQGFTMFDPGKIVRNQHVPPVVLTRIRKFADPVPMSAWSGESDLEFNYRDSMITFEFAALDFTAPAKNSYRHKLEGFDADWVDTRGRPRASYTNLRPGSYSFMVMGSNNDGVWNGEPTRVAFTVLPPPWKTWWAYSLYGLLVASAVALNVHSQAKKRQRAELLAEANRALEAEVEHRAEKEDALRREKEKAQRYLDIAEVIMLALDAEGRVQLINQKGIEVLGYPENEILGKDWCATFVRSEEREALREFLRESRPGSFAEYSVINAVGEERVVAWHSTPLVDDEGVHTGTLSSGTDVTQMLKLRQEKESAEIANAAKSQFLANMSHEIRTPMNGVLGMIELLNHSGLNERQRHFAVNAQRAAKSLLDLLNDILDLSKIEAGRLQLEEIEFEPRRLVDDVLVLFGQQARQRGLELRVGVDSGVAKTVSGDPVRLRQILSNLVGNAVKFTEAGFVALDVSTSGDAAAPSLRFEVRDTGIGMEKGLAKAVFEPFRQADGSTTRRFGGTGLGLTICRELVELMKGRIGVESELGTGSLFWFEVPLQAAKPAEKDGWAAEQPESENGNTRSARAEQARAFRGVRILLVEDNVLNQEVVRGMLEHLGGVADIAESGQRALTLFKEHTYDIVLMDCQMPGMDGFETTRRIRQLEALAAGAGTADDKRQVPIVAMTASALAGDREKCLASGMQDYLGKPFTMDQLAGLLDSWLPRRFAPVEPSLALAQSPDQGEGPAPPARISGGGHAARFDPTSASAEDGAEAIDAATLGEIRAISTAQGAAFLDRVIGVYLDSSPELVERIERAAACGDAEELFQAAHSLKSTSGSLGAKELARLCAELESAGRSGEMDGLQPLVERLMNEYGRVTTALAAELTEEAM